MKKQSTIMNFLTPSQKAQEEESEEDVRPTRMKPTRIGKAKKKYEDDDDDLDFSTFAL